MQAGLCQTCSETTLLVFSRGGSNIDGQKLENIAVYYHITKTSHAIYSDFFSAVKIEKFIEKKLLFLARLHEVHRAIVVTSVVRVYVYVRVTLSVKVF